MISNSIFFPYILHRLLLLRFLLLPFFLAIFSFDLFFFLFSLSTSTSRRIVRLSLDFKLLTLNGLLEFDSLAVDAGRRRCSPAMVHSALLWQTLHCRNHRYFQPSSMAFVTTQNHFARTWRGDRVCAIMVPAAYAFTRELYHIGNMRLKFHTIPSYDN